MHRPHIVIAGGGFAGVFAALSAAAELDRDGAPSGALLIVLERLSPAERAAFLLHDVFGYEFAEAAEALGRTPAATRQLAARARAHVDAGRPRFPPSGEEQRRASCCAARTGCSP